MLMTCWSGTQVRGEVMAVDQQERERESERERAKERESERERETRRKRRDAPRDQESGSRTVMFLWPVLEMSCSYSSCGSLEMKQRALVSVL